VNQDQCKTKLVAIRKPPEDFAVIFSGKRSRKVHGLYKPETREIIIHNRNFTSDNELMYTAIHEYAHHLHFLSSAAPVSNRSHTTRFWGIFHELLIQAEANGTYDSPFDTIPEFQDLTRRIKEKVMRQDGELMKELGALLIRAEKLCEIHHTSFSDYLDRVLALPRSSATHVMRISALDVDPRIGFENMKTVAAIRDPEDRKEAVAALVEGQSPDMIKLRYGPASRNPEVEPVPRSALAALERERDRLRAQIRRLEKRIELLDERIRKERG
jgi:hypothetical protein